MLYIYGTIYNNAETVLDSLNSIHYLSYKKLFIVDNYSNDGTYEILQQNREKYRLEITRIKCNRGQGRQLAMEKAMLECGTSDYLMTMDFDSIYGDDFIRLVSGIITSIHENCVYNNFLCLKNANAIPWRYLNNGEDWERMAHFASNGYNIYLKEVQIMNQYVEGSRDRRYASGMKYYYRIFFNTVELQRAWCFKSFKEFYNHVRKHKGVVLCAYIVSKFYKNYCYDTVINNRELVRKVVELA